MILIEGKEVKESDIGKTVTYIPNHAIGSEGHPDVERGVISSFNEKTIWIRFKAPNGESCNPKNLIWG